MKSKKEIAGRSVALYTFVCRCENEDPMVNGGHSLKEREEQRTTMLEWLNNNHLKIYLSEEELQIFNTPIQKKVSKDFLSKKLLHESIVSLLWSMQIKRNINSFYEYSIVDYDKHFNITPEYDFDGFVSKCKMRPESEIALQRDIAMLWKWRATEGAFIDKRMDVKKKLIEIFGEEIVPAVNQIPFTMLGEVDFKVLGKSFKKLSLSEMEKVRVIAHYRYLAYAWILGDEDWDDTDTST